MLPLCVWRVRVFVRLAQQLLVLASIWAVLLPLPAAALPLPELTQATSAGALIAWRAPAHVQTAQPIPPAPELLALRLPADGAPPPQIETLTSVAWSGALPQPAALPAQRMPDGDLRAPLVQVEPVAPVAPLTLVRTGQMRDLQIGIYQINPLFQDDSGWRQLTALTALVPGATLLDRPTAAELLAAPVTSTAISAPPPHPQAAQAGWQISVQAAGMQHLSATALQAAGLDLATLDVAALTLSLRGVPLPLEEVRSNGVLTALRFYAPTAGDRWNATTTYWLDRMPTPGPRMAVRDVRLRTGTTVQTRDTAFETGIWREPRTYESALPNPAQDRYVSRNLRTVPGGVAASATISLTTRLPSAPGGVTLRVYGGTTNQFPAERQLQVALGTQPQTRTLRGIGATVQEFAFATSAAQIAVRLLPSSQIVSFALDQVIWEVPVQLAFGGQGAHFRGVAGHWRYVMRDLPASATLYDVTDPHAPQRLLRSASGFEEAADSSRQYVLAGPGTLQEPPLAPRPAVDLTRPLNATTIYVVPDSFAAALTPLIRHRNAQGTPSIAVSAEAIYATWSGGDVDPEAIRSFVRYATVHWAVQPTALVLVGDGTNDPRNYTGIGQMSWLPPYLAEVDPWLGETACEPCFAQLHGDSPLDDPLPDLAVGRLPVKSAPELTVLITKIIRYEMDQSIGNWRSRVVAVADNTDDGGDFALLADLQLRLHPPGVTRERIYYDPDAPAWQPWRTADSQLARDRTIAAFEQGAGLLIYTGHGLQFQWAVTSPPANVLLFVDDAPFIQSGGRYPIVLSMTCLSSAFQQPALRGTTIDEALLLSAQGGAIAVWGSTGLGVVFGHDALERGFVTALWAAQPTQPEIGALMLAGYLELFTVGGRGQESLRTFALLGDPRTPARVNATGVDELFVPLIGS